MSYSLRELKNDDYENIYTQPAQSGLKPSKTATDCIVKKTNGAGFLTCFISAIIPPSIFSTAFVASYINGSHAFKSLSASAAII